MRVMLGIVAGLPIAALFGLEYLATGPGGAA
jgi:hypothetical protein